jgi:hypothetical protein
MTQKLKGPPTTGVEGQWNLKGDPFSTGDSIHTVGINSRSFLFMQKCEPLDFLTWCNVRLPRNNMSGNNETAIAIGYIVTFTTSFRLCIIVLLQNVSLIALKKFQSDAILNVENVYYYVTNIAQHRAYSLRPVVFVLIKNCKLWTWCNGRLPRWCIKLYYVPSLPMYACKK